jgi:hypothetical protein
MRGEAGEQQTIPSFGLPSLSSTWLAEWDLLSRKPRLDLHHPEYLNRRHCLRREPLGLIHWQCPARASRRVMVCCLALDVAFLEADLELFP